MPPARVNWRRRAERFEKEAASARTDAEKLRAAMAGEIPPDQAAPAAESPDQVPEAQQLYYAKQVQSVFDMVATARDPKAAAAELARSKSPGARWKLPDGMLPIIKESATGTFNKYLPAVAAQYPERVLLALLTPHIIKNLIADFAPYVLAYLAQRNATRTARDGATTRDLLGLGRRVEPAPPPGVAVPAAEPEAIAGDERGDTRAQRIGEIDAGPVDIGAPLTLPDC